MYKTNKKMTVLNWDGSNLGDLTKNFISITLPEEKDAVCVLCIKIENEYINCNAWEYSGDIPLIIDEIKPLFGLKKIGRHRCEIDGEKLLISKIEVPDEKLLPPDKMDYSVKELNSIRRAIIFRSIFGLKSQTNVFWYRPGIAVISNNEQRLCFNSENRMIVSEINLKRYFKSDKDFLDYSTYAMLCNSKSKKKFKTNNDKLKMIAVILKINIASVVRRINDDYSYIGNEALKVLNNVISNLEPR